MNKIFFAVFFFLFSNLHAEELKNGMKVVDVMDNSLPLLEMGMLIKGGASLDPMAKGGLTQLTVSTWLENPKRNEKLAPLAGELQGTVTSDFVLFGGSVLSQRRDEFLKIFIEALHQPQFQESHFLRRKSFQISSLKKISEEPESWAQVLFRSFLYGPHPYGQYTLGRIEDVQNLRLRDIEDQFKSLINPSQIVFVMAGDYNKEFKEKVISQLETFKVGLVSEAHWPRPPEIKSVQIKVVERPGATQTQIVMGHLGVPRNHRDYLKLNLASLVLGGTFTSRLNEKIRVQGGLTYSISSDFDGDMMGGLFQISTSTKNENTVRVVRDTRKVLSDFINAGVKKDELESAKNYLIGFISRSVETSNDLAFWAAAEIFYALNHNSIRDVIDEIQGTTLSDVNKAIKTYLSADKLKIVVVGPSKDSIDFLRSQGVIEL